MALVLGGTVLLLFALSYTATQRAAFLVADEGSGGWAASLLLEALGDILPFLFTALVVLFLYRILPHPRPRVREIWPGALVAAVGISIVRGGLDLYFDNLADFGALYGSLGALMALLLFVYGVSMVLVFGAEFAAEWSRLPEDEETHRQVRAGRDVALRAVRARGR